jgi:mRNA turnover protein 4
MVKSKRSRVVPLTKTKKTAGAEKKDKIFDRVHNCLDTYDYIYSFRYKNMTSLPFQELRKYWNKGLYNYFIKSRFLIGKNKVMQVSLGKDTKSSYKKNSYKLAEVILNLISSILKETQDYSVVQKAQILLLSKFFIINSRYFQNYSCPYFGTIGTVPLQTIVLERGSDGLKDFPSSMESQFRQLGVHVKVDNSKLVLLNDYVVCKAGKPLDANQAMMTVNKYYKYRNIWE